MLAGNRLLARLAASTRSLASSRSAVRFFQPVAVPRELVAAAGDFRQRGVDAAGKPARMVVSRDYGPHPVILRRRNQLGGFGQAADGLGQGPLQPGRRQDARNDGGGLPDSRALCRQAGVHVDASDDVRFETDGFEQSQPAAFEPTGIVTRTRRLGRERLALATVGGE